MSVFGKIGHFFEVVASHIKGAFITLFGDAAGAQLAMAAENWAKTELGKVSIEVVKALESAAGSGADKKVEAFDQILDALKNEGKSIPNSLVNFAIEFALQIVRGGK